MSGPSAIDRLRAEFSAKLARVVTERDLQDIRDHFLGRKRGVLPALMKTVAAAPPETRPTLGRLTNELKHQIETQIAERRTALEAARAPAGGVDVTLPGRAVTLGHRHPVTLLQERIEAIFSSMGYEIVQGPQVEDDYHNFEALNMPSEHPARDMQDTLYLTEPLRTDHAAQPGARAATLLRTHTSCVQIRYMETHQPPVRIIAPGPVYRRDNPDLTHLPMFHQVEGLVVGEHVSMGDLKGTLVSFLRELFDPQTSVMFRPSFFPYTEPSAEVFIGCLFCGAQGCAVCKKTGWLEILGSGMVNPAVFEAVGYDPERYTGWAFGMGIERVAMLKYGVDDMRAFFENDLRFLEQYPY